MADPDSIKKLARQRASELKLPYAGALLPQEAHILMGEGAKLVDVRTKAELEWVGRVPGSLAVEWNTWPGGKANPDFIPQLEAQASKGTPVMFLCRSGGRSHSAAMAAAQAGYGESYNVLEGFEGDKNSESHRNTSGGWRVAGLPWIQS
jgi:rhodanese-related sulfurtransferase